MIRSDSSSPYSILKLVTPEATQKALVSRLLALQNNKQEETLVFLCCCSLLSRHHYGNYTG
ncbi:hypothetical protein J6590_015889 [Homalodisca vitripennis]|nr:hypothetical protein J6590_015889 [Homalodisca vitripennis]